MAVHCLSVIIPHWHLELPETSYVSLTSWVAGVKLLPVDACQIFFLVLVWSALGSYLQSL